MIFRKIRLAVLLGIIAFCVTLCACNKAPSKVIPTKIIKISGSSTFAPLLQEISKQFMSTYTDILVNINTSDSGTGLKQLTAGTVDIAMSDVFANEKVSPEVIKDCIDYKICVEGYAIIANADVSISNLSQNQIISIFTRKTTNWKNIGGTNIPISIISRPSESGVRTIFRKYALNGFSESETNSKLVAYNSQVKKEILLTSGSIGYISMSQIKNDNTIKIINFENIEPTEDNIKNGKYPIWSYQHLYTKSNTKDFVSTFINFMKTNDYKSKVKEMGFIPIDEMLIQR